MLEKKIPAKKMNFVLIALDHTSVISVTSPAAHALVLRQRIAFHVAQPITIMMVYVQVSKHDYQCKFRCVNT